MPRYLLCSRSADCPPDHPLVAQLRRRAETEGQVVSDLTPLTWLACGGPGRPQVTPVGGWRLIGDVFNRRRPNLGPSAVDAAHDYERKLLARFWGRYVGVRFDADGRVAALLRDPSGALDALWWRQGPLTLIASDLPDWLTNNARAGWRLDSARIEAALHDPCTLAGDLLLTGPKALLPGAMQIFSDTVPVTLWRPDWIARSAAPQGDDEAAAAVRDSVDEAVSGLLGQGERLAAEISGGLDSGIVAAALAAAGADHVRLWLNAWGPDDTADERPWAEALATHLGVSPTCVPRAVGRLTLDHLEAFARGARPALSALDGLHDEDWARRFTAAGIEAVVTGKGGDSLFIQPADMSVFADLCRTAGWRAFLSPALVRLARWNERSVWTLAKHALRRDWRPDVPDASNPLLAPRRSTVDLHPWLRTIGDLGPAKRRQILGLVQGGTLHGPSFQTQVVSVHHPLLSQPVVETCLSLPVAQLTLGRRDRALAREAFRDRLPQALVERRSKGEMTAFYGHLIADALDVLRPWLLEGRLAALGLIDRDAADAALSREALAWRGGYVDIMTTAAIEGWVRAWAQRLPGA